MMNMLLYGKEQEYGGREADSGSIGRRMWQAVVWRCQITSLLLLGFFVI